MGEKLLERFEAWEEGEEGSGRLRARLRFGAYQLRPEEVPQIQGEVENTASGCPYVIYFLIEADAIQGEVRGSYADVRRALIELEERGWRWG